MTSEEEEKLVVAVHVQLLLGPVAAAAAEEVVVEKTMYKQQANVKVEMVRRVAKKRQQVEDGQVFDSIHHFDPEQ